MDFGLSFSFVFKDEEWFKKLAIPALISLIPIIGPLVVSGWGLKIAKNVIDGKKVNALPDVDFGADIGRGFMAFLITAIYSLPAVILSSISGVLFALTDDSANAFSVILFIVGGVLALVVAVLSILIAFMTVAGIANYIAKGEFGAAFNFKQVFSLIKGSFVSWLLVLLGEIVALGIIAPLGTIICVIGVFLTVVYGTAVYSHLIGQAYNASAKPEVEEVVTP